MKSQEKIKIRVEQDLCGLASNLQALRKEMSVDAFREYVTERTPFTISQVQDLYVLVNDYNKCSSREVDHD